MWGRRTVERILSEQVGSLRLSVFLTVLNSNPSRNTQIEAMVSLQQLFFNTSMTSVPSAKDCTVSASEVSDAAGLEQAVYEVFWALLFKNQFSDGHIIFVSPKL